MAANTRHFHAPLLLLAWVAAAAPGGSATTDKTPEGTEKAQEALKPLPGDAWPGFRGGQSMTAWVEGKISESPRLEWTFDAGCPIESTAAICDGRVYVGSDEGLVALELKVPGSKGKLLWKAPTDAGVRSSPLFRSGVVYAGDDEGIFHAVGAEDGKERWKYETEGGAEIISSANTDGDRILFGSYDGSLYCLSASSGKLLWKYETEGPVHCGPSIAQGRTFVAGCDGQLRIVDVAKGSEIAALDVGARCSASPVVVGNRLFVGTLGSEVLAINWKKQSVIWRYQDPQRQFPFYSSAAAAVAGKSRTLIVVVGGRDKKVHGLRASDGKELWSLRTKAAVDASPVVVGNQVIAAGLDGNLYVLDLETGKERWRFAAGGGFAASPAVAQGRLVISTEDGQVFCFLLAP